MVTLHQIYNGANYSLKNSPVNGATRKEFGNNIKMVLQVGVGRTWIGLICLRTRECCGVLLTR